MLVVFAKASELLFLAVMTSSFNWALKAMWSSLLGTLGSDIFPVSVREQSLVFELVGASWT